MQQKQTEEITGTIERALFQDAESGFSVLILSIKNNQKITITGHLSHVNPGQQVSLAGAWTMHPKFGRQFEVCQCIAHNPTTLIGLKKYLGSGLIKGIGPTYAERLVEHFGLEVLSVIEKTPERLSSIPGIGAGRITRIIQAWQDQKEISSIMVFLQEKGISASFSAKIYKHYKQESLAILTNNPYKLIDDIWGIGFKTADQIAQKIGLASDSPKRIRAGVCYAISSVISMGHLYIELEELKKTSIELLGLANDNAIELCSNALSELYQEDRIKFIAEQDKQFVTLSQYFWAERGVANKILQLQERPAETYFDINEVYSSLRAPEPGKIQLNEDQQRGIMACLTNRVTIITGGPGTGKTTLIKKLLSTCEEAHVTYKLAAPTGRAAKRISESTGRLAMTIHRLLGFDGTTMRFVHNEMNRLNVQFLIIDEASMIDIFLMHAICKALPLTAHLICIGDVDQLPSVGAGNVLHDLIASEKVACVRLTEIFRQAQDSLIIVNAHRVNKGIFPTSAIPGSKSDYLFIKEEDPQKIPHHLERIFAQILSMHKIKADAATVLVPMNRGIAGTQTLNHVLQKMLNPQETAQSILHNGFTFKIGDRVMQIRNNYDKIVFNGDTGTIVGIDLEEKRLDAQFADRVISYDFIELNELVLAYAISIHKSQGSEYDAAIIPLFTSHFALLQRNLVYTAITRAKRLCILIGQPKAIAIALRNNKGRERKTFLTTFLTANLP